MTAHQVFILSDFIKLETSMCVLLFCFMPMDSFEMFQREHLKCFCRFFCDIIQTLFYIITKTLSLLYFIMLFMDILG